jgi:hypothetical protein
MTGIPPGFGQGVPPGMMPEYQTLMSSLKTLYGPDSAMTEEGRGVFGDGQTIFDKFTGVVNHGESAKENLKEAGWNGIGAIPVVGGIANVGRGLFNGVKGLLGGDGGEAVDGLKQMGKGALFSIPGFGSAIAGAFAAKDLADAGAHGLAAMQQKSMGGYEGQLAMARSMMLGNTGQSLGTTTSESELPAAPAWQGE